MEANKRNILIVLDPAVPACPYMEVGPYCGFVEECVVKPYKYTPLSLARMVSYTALP